MYGINAKSIVLTFDDFFTEDGYDYLSVGRGGVVTEDTKMLHLSGKFPPNSVTAEGPVMWIEFTSNDFAGRSGFQLVVQWMGTVCKFVTCHTLFNLLSQDHQTNTLL